MSKKLTINDFIERSQKIHNDKYDYSKACYVDSKTKVIITCPIHGDFEQIPNAHLNGKGCPKCYGFKKTTQDFINEANSIHNYKYDYSKSEYKTNQVKVCIVCPEHGEFWVTPNNHISKRRGCPRCQSSIGENLIENYLIKHNIKYARQFPIDIDESINVTGKAHIDFYLPNYNVFIEYNGEQHYKPIKHFGGQLRFEKQQRRDSFIQKYCQENNIKLIVIKYSQSINKIQKCVESELSQYG